MKRESENYHRRSIRLQEYDYSHPGAYFVTICTRNRECVFGDIVNGNMKCSKIGIMAEKILIETFNAHKLIKLDAYVIMPNHVHIIICIDNNEGVTSNASTVDKIKSSDCRGVIYNAQNNEYYSKISPKYNSLSVVIRKYKAGVSRWCNKNGHQYFKWQRNYYEHVIRNENDLQQTREYIISNSLKWELDSENPKIWNKKI